MMRLMGLTRAVMDEYLEGRIVGMLVNWRDRADEGFRTLLDSNG